VPQQQVPAAKVDKRVMLKVSARVVDTLAYGFVIEARGYI
jgi:hypothetical protein